MSRQQTSWRYLKLTIVQTYLSSCPWIERWEDCFTESFHIWHTTKCSHYQFNANRATRTLFRSRIKRCLHITLITGALPPRLQSPHILEAWNLPSQWLQSTHTPLTSIETTARFKCLAERPLPSFNGHWHNDASPWRDNHWTFYKQPSGCCKLKAGYAIKFLCFEQIRLELVRLFSTIAILQYRLAI